jgi:hypothetical protein
VVEALRRSGRQAFFVDLSLPQSGLSVVRSVVPTMAPLLEAHGRRSPVRAGAVLA